MVPTGSRTDEWLVQMKHDQTQFVRGTIVGGNSEAERMDLIKDREWGTVTSQKAKRGMVTVRWHGTGKFEKWHTDLLEIIDRAGHC